MLSDSGHKTVPMESGGLGKDGYLVAAAAAQGGRAAAATARALALPKTATSFTDAGGIRLQDLMRKRLNRPHNVQAR